MEWENKPFNDVVDYFNKVEGNASNIGKADKKRLRIRVRHSDAPKNFVSQKCFTEVMSILENRKVVP
jgi:hypothetical protein